jgi:[acyl-carrier-protein] S-malonyltransferase
MYVTLANHNSPQQCVIAGTEAGLAKAEEFLKALPVKRLKFIRLKVSAAFHSKLMQEAADEFAEAVSKIKFSSPECDFYSNVTAGKITSISADYLSAHIVSPVMFVAELSKLSRDGYDTFIEIGPNKILSGLVGKTVENAKILNIEDAAGLEKAKQELS